MSEVLQLEHFAEHLQEGSRLKEGAYVIEKYLNAGGFGITYLARNAEGKRIVIKECFPSAICRRSNSTVTARSTSYSNDFQSAIKVFVREARNLANVSHRNIVQVHEVFEENNTAYMAIDYIKGKDLLAHMEASNPLLTPAFISECLKKLLDAVEAMHKADILHRDIAPDNILIREDGEPILIDFGAAREESSKKSRILSTLHVIKDGYSPQEFYVAGSAQSYASDLYSLAASFYHCISGEMPPNSQNRLAALAEGGANPYVPLKGRFPAYRSDFLSAIDTALEVIPKNRIQSAQEWSKAIDPYRAGKIDPQLRKAIVHNARLEVGVKVAAAFFVLVLVGLGYFWASKGLAVTETASEIPTSSVPIRAPKQYLSGEVPRRKEF